MAGTTERIHAAAMKLRQFGRLQIGRLVGSCLTSEGRYKAWIDTLERSYFMRGELNAMAALLIRKGVCTEEEWARQVADEYEHFAGELAKSWPEVVVDEKGFTIEDLPAFHERSKRESWPL